MKSRKRFPSIRFITDFLVFAALFACSSAVLILGMTTILRNAVSSVSSTSVSDATRPIIVLDAGHGGEDGGASGADGMTEKELNLLVSDGITQILSAMGFDVRPTRTEDRLLYDLYGDLSDYTGHKKTYDLRNRLRFAKECNAGLFVSIHMNKFPETKYSGLQVYYSPNCPESKAIARMVQSYTKLYLQPQNNREIKKATSSIYLLNRIDIPAVMVECGFLSNPEELAKLEDSAYQQQLALTIACAIAETAGIPLE